MSVLSSVTGGRKFSLFLSFTSDLMLNLCIDTYVILIVHHSLTQHLLPSLNKQSSPLLSLVLCPVSVLGPAKLPSWWTKKFSSPLTTGPPPPVILMAILFVRWVKLPPKKRSKSPFSLNTRFHIDLSVRLSWTVSHPREIIGSSPRRIWNVWSGGIEKTWEVWISAVLIPLGVRISMMRYMRGGCRMVISRLVSVSSPFLHSVCTKDFGLTNNADIADVSHFVHPDNPMDSEAASRGTTVYLVDKRIDMLPSLLGTNLCSLRPFVERLAFSVIWVGFLSTASLSFRNAIGLTQSCTLGIERRCGSRWREICQECDCVQRGVYVRSRSVAQRW